MFFDYVDENTELINATIARAKYGVRYSHVPGSGFIHRLNGVRFTDCQTAVFVENSSVVLTNVYICYAATPYAGVGSYAIQPIEVRFDCNTYTNFWGNHVSIGEAVENTGLTWFTWSSLGSSANWYGIIFHDDPGYFDGDAARSGSVADGVTGYLQTTVVGPGVLTFNWKVASQAEHDFLKFSINGTLWRSMSGLSMDWQHEEFYFPSGTYTLLWEYAKDSSGNANGDVAWLDKVYFNGPMAEMPAFSPLAGVYPYATNVQLSSATAGASIYYTTNGTDPTTNSTLYTAPITVSSSTLIKTKAFASGMNSSPATIASYVINSAGTVATPVIAPFGGTYNHPVTVTLSSATTGASIYYTTNGSLPSTSSTLYTNAFGLRGIETLRAKAFKSGMVDSGVETAVFNVDYSDLADALDCFDLNFTTGGSSYWYLRRYYDNTDDAIHVGIASGQTNYIQTTVLGPGTLSFTWAVSSGDNYDTFSLYVDGLPVGAINRNASRRSETVQIGSGSHTIQWVYKEDDTANQGTGALDAVQFTPGSGNNVATTQISPDPLSPSPWNVTISSATAGASIYYTTDGSLPKTNSTLYTAPFSVSSTPTQVSAVAVKSGMLDSPINTVIYKSTSQDWTVQSALDNGSLYRITNSAWYQDWNTYSIPGSPFSLRSPSTADSSQSPLDVTVDGPGTLSFYWKVASQPTYDNLIFYLDGVEKSRISDNVGWTQVSYNISAGPHWLRWVYSKDECCAWYSDAAWVDYVQVTPLSGIVATPTFSPNGGPFSSATNVTLSCSTSGATIYYTLKGGDPTTASTVYTGPFSVGYSTTVKAIAAKSGMYPSSIGSASFTINQSFSPTDTDGDGLSDAWEQFYFGNLNQSGTGDWNGNGISNLLEYQNGTNPLLGIGLQVFTGLK